MAMSDYTIENKQIEHVKTHFSNQLKSGSTFNTAVFKDYTEVLNYVNTHSPIQVHSQSNGREVHVFSLPKDIIVGFQGISNVAELGNLSFDTEMRNGFDVKFAKVKELIPTNQFCVIVEPKEHYFQLITCFPGMYAPPFPYPGLNEAELLFAENFWKEHVLLKII